MRLFRGIDPGTPADQNPPSRVRWWAPLSVVILCACAGDGVTAPEVSPAPAAQPVVILLDGGNSGIRAGEPIVFIVDGKRIAGDVLGTIDPSRISSIKVRRMGPDRPQNEVHITLYPPPR